MGQPQFDKLMSEFGAALGIPDMQPDEFGCCCINVGDTAFHVLVSPEGDTVTVFTEIGELPDDVEPEVLRQMLAANYFWSGTRGATLGVQPETGAVVLAQRLPLESVTVAELERLMKQFVEVAETGIPGVAGPASEEADGDAAVDEPFPSDPHSLRV